MKKLQYLLLPSILLVVFIIFTILVKTVDVQYINGIGFLGFYSLNTQVNNFVVSLDNNIFNIISNLLLYLAFASIAPFAVMGLVQLIVRKGFKKIDPVIYLLLVGYVAIVAFYFIFELVKINYSPLSTVEDLKPSYPSSHVFIFIAMLGINLFGLFHYVKMPKTIKIVALCGVIALFIAMIVTRLLSGHHYLTDIFGGVLLSLVILTSFDALTRALLTKKEEVSEE